VVDASTIDRINILQAAMLAMRTAVEGLAGAGLKADHLLIDGNRCAALGVPWHRR
jgi:ribonuclease HII